MQPENELTKLKRANDVSERTLLAKRWKENGKKIIGTLCSYVPEEAITAAGMLPWRVCGSWTETVTLARAYRPVNSCQYCTHVLNALLSGELDFLDAVIGTSRDQDLVRLLDVWGEVAPNQFILCMYLPHENSSINQVQFGKEIQKLVVALQQLAQEPITDKALSNSIEIHNRTRRLLGAVYELRKKPKPPLSGSEILGLTMAAAISPKDEFNDRLKALLPYLEKRVAPVKAFSPRLLLSADCIDNNAYLEAIENLGCIIAMDDLDTGSRYFWDEVSQTLCRHQRLFRNLPVYRENRPSSIPQ